MVMSGDGAIWRQDRIGGFECAHQGSVELFAALNICANAVVSVELHTGNGCLSGTVTSDVPHAARAAPTLATGTGRQMLGQALNVLKATPAEG